MSDVLKQLKYSLDRKTLETMYTCFIPPKLKYCSHIGDNCFDRDSKCTGIIQLETAQIVTGA
jgi:hypothetical protein